MVWILVETPAGEAVPLPIIGTKPVLLEVDAGFDAAPGEPLA
jgi:hypothetical protein